MNKRKAYTTRRLTIRPLEVKDYPLWLQAQELSYPKKDKFDLDPLPVSRRTSDLFKKNVIRQRKEAQNDISYTWNFFSKKTKELMGWIAINTICRGDHQIANLGWFTINTYRNQGYASEALKKLISMTFKDLKFHRLEASIDRDNKASLYLAKKIGLHREGIKKHYWYQNGRWEDQVVYITTPELWNS